MGPIEVVSGFCEKLGIEVPSLHPETGEPLVKGTVSIETPVQTIHEGPPRPPSRALYRWDDDLDDFVYARPLTASEYGAAMRDYEEAVREWAKTNGIHHIPGPMETSGKFRTAGGSECDGLWDGSRWLWVRWTVVG